MSENTYPINENTLRGKISLEAREETYPQYGEKVERDRNLVRDFLSGKFTSKELQHKYDISHTRYYQILNRYKLPEYRNE